MAPHEFFARPAHHRLDRKSTLLRRDIGREQHLDEQVAELVLDFAVAAKDFCPDTERRRLFEREGKTAEADLLAKCAANLMRMWCDD